MNVNLRGITKQILENMVKEGYASTLSEAIRLAIISFGESHSEEHLVKRKLDRIDNNIKVGKRKVLSPGEALGKYVKFTK